MNYLLCRWSLFSSSNRHQLSVSTSRNQWYAYSTYTIAQLLLASIMHKSYFQRNHGLYSLFVSLTIGLNMPAVPVSNATQYIPAPGSPVDEACKCLNHLTCSYTLQLILTNSLNTLYTILFSFFLIDYHAQSSPYSPPYDDTSSPHSIACSPHSNISCSPIACTGANFETYMPPPPPVDSLASMASTGVSLPPITTIPLTTTTSLHFPTELDNNQKSGIYTTAPPPPNFYPPISQTGAWPQPQHLARFNEPGFVPPHSAAMICTSVADGGEVAINVIDQHTGFPETDIAYYPLTPESPENRQTAYACPADFAAMHAQKPGPGLYLPGGPVLCAPFSTHVKPTPNKGETILKLIAACIEQTVS